MRRFLYTSRIFVVCFFLFNHLAYSYNVDSLMTSIGQVSLDEQHTKVSTEINKLLGTSPTDAIELGNYWINILNEKQQPVKAADILLVTADAYYRMANYSLNLQYAQTALKIYKANNNADGEAKAMRAIGFTYRKMGQNEDAYDYMQQSITPFEKAKDYEELATTYNQMGNLIEEWKGDLVAAEGLYRRSIYNAEQNNNQVSLSYSYEFIGIIKSKQGAKDSAVWYLNQSLEIRKKLGDPMMIALSYTNLAEVMDQNGDVHGANKLYNQALNIASAIKFHDLENFIYGNLSKIHQKKGNLDSAITYLEAREALRDSLNELEKTKEFARLKAQFESDIQEEKIHTLNKEIELDEERDRNRLYLFAGILTFVVLSGVIIGIILYNRHQRKVATERIEHERLRNKMIIEAEEKERTRIAKDLHDSLGQMLAALKMNLNSLSTSSDGNGQFKKTTQILDDTITEMRSISHAMMPESLVKNGLAQALMDISNHVETNQTKVNVNVGNWKGWTSTGEYVLYRIVQELLNNTLKHAQATTVNIELNQFDDEINLIYEDDGKGFDMSSVKSDGIGLKNMNNRISSISGHIEFDSKPGVGTTAIISVPLKTNT